MDLSIDVPWIPQAAEAAGVNDPAPDDYGVPVSAVARAGPNCSSGPSTTVPTPRLPPWYIRWAGAAGWSAPTTLHEVPQETEQLVAEHQGPDDVEEAEEPPAKQ